MFLNNFYGDLGNRYIKTIDPNGAVIKRAAAIKQIKAYEDEIKGTEESPIISFMIGGKSVTYMIGDKAQGRKGQSNLHSHDKMLQALPFLLGALPAHPQLEIERLMLAVPDSRFKPHQLMLQELVGTHFYTRNGKKQSVTIRSVKLVDEIKAAYLYGVRNGLFALPDQKNAVYSAGGGDFCAAVIENGEIIREHTLVIKRGVVELANLIAAEKKDQQQSNLDPIEIMNLIARQPDEDGRYITNHGVDFTDVIDPCVSQWIAELMGDVKIAWREELKDVRQTLIVGGGATHFSAYRAGMKVKAKCIIAPQAQEAIVLGLKYA